MATSGELRSVPASRRVVVRRAASMGCVRRVPIAPLPEKHGQYTDAPRCVNGKCGPGGGVGTAVAGSGWRRRLGRAAVPGGGVNGGVDGTRTRDLLRDRQAF